MGFRGHFHYFEFDSAFDSKGVYATLLLPLGAWLGQFWGLRPRLLTAFLGYQCAFHYPVRDEAEKDDNFGKWSESISVIIFVIILTVFDVIELAVLYFMFCTIPMATDLTILLVFR